MSLANTYKSEIHRFTRLVADGVESWVAAGEILARLVSESGEEIYEIISASVPGLSRETLELFTAIGRREIYPLLAMEESEGANHLAGLPYEQQELFYREGVPLVDRDGDEWSVEITPVNRLSRRECLQVFDANRIRTEKEQRAWITEQERRRQMDREKARAKPAAHKAHTICRGDMSGHEPDRPIVTRSPVSLDALAKATPIELFRLALDQAHAAMMDARRHLTTLRKNSPKDSLISSALNCIGQLRFAANQNEI